MREPQSSRARTQDREPPDLLWFAMMLTIRSLASALFLAITFFSALGAFSGFLKFLDEREHGSTDNCRDWALVGVTSGVLISIGALMIALTVLMIIRLSSITIFSFSIAFVFLPILSFFSVMACAY
jgi:hypothetical protein